MLGECCRSHRHQEFLAFLLRIVTTYPDSELHPVLDNSSTHRTPEVQRWLERSKRVTFRFAPTGASWMNMVETWFSILTRRSVRRGTYASAGRPRRLHPGVHRRRQPACHALHLDYDR